MAVSLVTTTGTHKSRYANVGAPGNLQLTGTDTLSAAAIVRADAAATGKRQFGARLTSAVDNTFVIGIDDGTKNLDDLSFDIPGRHTTGGFVLIIGTWGW